MGFPPSIPIYSLHIWPVGVAYAWRYLESALLTSGHWPRLLVRVRMGLLYREGRPQGPRPGPIDCLLISWKSAHWDGEPAE